MLPRFAAHGHFSYDSAAKQYVVTSGGRPATAFLFNLISQLQFNGTVPMIDVQACARWLADVPRRPRSRAY
jgi:hypothetical protein